MLLFMLRYKFIIKCTLNWAFSLNEWKDNPSDLRPVLHLPGNLKPLLETFYHTISYRPLCL